MRYPQLVGRSARPAVRSRRTLRTPAVWVAGIAMVAMVGVTGASDAGANAGVPAGPTIGGADAAGLAAYWTPARMAEALAGPDGASVAQALAASTNAAPGDPTYDGPFPGEHVPPSKPFDGTPQAGTFFWTDESGTGRTCSGSVVHSPHRDLVLSAGHCLMGFAGDTPVTRLAFAPGYHDGAAPYGLFPVKTDGVYVSAQYYRLGVDAGAEYDFGFAVTLPEVHGRALEDAIGKPGYTLLTDSGYVHAPVHMIGYPGGEATTKPIECWSYTTQWDSTDPADPGSYPRIPCQGFVDGTSGGPMLVSGEDGAGQGGDSQGRSGVDEVIGVIGGVHTGGNTPDVSYSAYFGDATRELYRAAVAGVAPAQP